MGARHRSGPGCLWYALIAPYEGNVDLAERYYSKAIELNPNSAELYYNRGLAYAYTGTLEQRWGQLERALTSVGMVS